jgi:hypothetical protein
MGFSLFMRMTKTIRAMTASGHGNQKPPQLSPTRSSAAITAATISTALRVLGLVLTAAWSCPSSGTNSHAAPYSTKPAPPKKQSTTKTTRRMVGSMLRWRPSPPATPATLRSVTLRRSWV